MSTRLLRMFRFEHDRASYLESCTSGNLLVYHCLWIKGYHHEEPHRSHDQWSSGRSAEKDQPESFGRDGARHMDRRYRPEVSEMSFFEEISR